MDALANLECRVVEEVTGGTHPVFLAEVEHATGREGTPLAYSAGSSAASSSSMTTTPTATSALGS